MYSIFPIAIDINLEINFYFMFLSFYLANYLQVKNNKKFLFYFSKVVEKDHEFQYK